MEVRRAIPPDAPAIAAFMREEFVRRPEIQGDVELWTDGFALKQVERHYCVLSLEEGQVIGACIFVNAEIVLWDKPVRADHVAVMVGGGGKLKQVRALDCIFKLTYERRWQPEGIAVCVTEGPLGSPGVGYWRHVGGSVDLSKGYAWGIVPTEVIIQRVRR